MPKTECNMCSKAFSVKQSRLDAGGGKFCSRACHHESMRNGEYVRCDTCDTETYKSPQDLQSSQSDKFFCSKSCQTVWRNKQFSGSDHALWKNGANAYRRILNTSSKPQKCKRCGIDDRRVLEGHHIDGDRSNNKLENLCWLCHNCHRLIHKDEQKREEFMAAVV